MNNKPWENNYSRYDYDSPDIALAWTLGHEIVRQQGIQIGDYVQVMREFDFHELGETCGWSAYMDQFIGTTCEVVDIDAGVGAEINAPPVYALELNRDPYTSPVFWFPAFVLRKLSAEEIREFKK